MSLGPTPRPPSVQHGRPATWPTHASLQNPMTMTATRDCRAEDGGHKRECAVVARDAAEDIAGSLMMMDDGLRVGGRSGGSAFWVLWGLKVSFCVGGVNGVWIW